MARDEALLQACRLDSPITLRFYAWSPPTISLGYFQGIDEYERLSPPARDLPVVRRTTGGGAILHDLEVTYSLVVPLSHTLVAGRPNRLYELAHQAIIAAVGSAARKMSHCDGDGACDQSGQRGPFFCFERRHALDVVVDDPHGPAGTAKLAGSAQRRTTKAILQHGSIILDSRFPQQPAATWSQIAGEIEFDAAVRRLTPQFERMLGVALSLSEWKHAELATAADLEERYAGRRWTVERER